MSAALQQRLLTALPPLAALPADLGELAAQARLQFDAVGLPQAREESWRYSPMRALERLDPMQDGSAASASATVWPGVAGCLSRIDADGITLLQNPPEGIELRVLDAPGLAAELGASWLPQQHGPAAAFRWLNAADPRRLLVVDVHSEVSGVWSLNLIHAAQGLTQSRIVLRLHPGASVSLLEQWQGPDAAAGLANVWIEADLAAGSRLQWLRLNQLGAAASLVQHSDFRLQSEAHLGYHTVDLGAAWARHELSMDLLGDAASSHQSGVFVLGGRQHLDTQLRVRHQAGNCVSQTLWKGVAQGRSRGVFDGLIAVAPGADGSDAQLKTANLLLSPHAEIDAKPELIIEADEVTCSHGATVGQLDERALFYLRSRGLPEALARQMLTVAFCSEALASIEPQALRDAVDLAVAERLPSVAQGAG